jgi:hypothetical protein
MTETKVVQVGRNEPCPCNSGKKYKRCCGVSAAPKLSEPKQPAAGGGAGPLGQDFLNGMDPQMLSQMMQAFQRLPKGQLQRLQSLMQRAMSGKDITSEAQEMERSLPPDFQELMKSFSMTAFANAAQGEGAEASQGAMGDQNALPLPPMSEEEAKRIVAEAAAAGKISDKQAESLLGEKAETEALPGLANAHSMDQTVSDSGSASSEAGDGSKFGKFWKNLAGKRNS